MLAEQGAREEEALTQAVSFFKGEFEADMEVLKAGGMPYQVTTTVRRPRSQQRNGRKLSNPHHRRSSRLKMSKVPSDW